MGIEGGGGLKGKGFDKTRQRQEEEAKKYSGGLKGTLLDSEAPDDHWAIGKKFVNRDLSISDPEGGVFEIVKHVEEKGKRRLVLRNLKKGMTTSKSEEEMRDAIAQGKWREEK